MIFKISSSPLTLILHQAGITLGVQIQLLTSDSNATTATARVLLTLAIISELFGVIIALNFLRFHKYTNNILPSEPLPIMTRLMSSMPTLLISIGILGLAAALVVETFKI
jgi:hypothetical protein